MLLKATITNCLWTASNLPAYFRFRQALRDPRLAQQRKLRALISQNANTAFGMTHRFAEIRNSDDFTRRVPLSDYNDLEPWIARIRRGDPNVLTREPVTHLIPTSGSTAARKLIPFTANLPQEFNAALGPWLVDLARLYPAILGGPAYWSITPSLNEHAPESSAVPIGFASDTEYLGGNRRSLANAIMAVPSSVGRAKSLDEFRYKTLLHLLRCPELRVISVWHPSFLTLLLDSLPDYWDRLLPELDKQRTDELRHVDPLNPATIWPRLRLISCWGDGAAALALQDLRSRFQSVRIQPKGLLATEAFVTLPFAGKYPLALESHFFEFIDSNGEAVPVDKVRQGEEYEIVVTTSGGLWRYRLGDRVLVSGRLEKTPSLTFLGRAGNVSDLFGEKLSETFVATALAEVFGQKAPRFALLAPDHDHDGYRYTLYMQGETNPHWPEILDRALRRNPHYAYCRNLGQLLTPRIFIIASHAFESFAAHQSVRGARLGDVKPASLSRTSGWSQIFSGTYLTKFAEPRSDILAVH